MEIDRVTPGGVCMKKIKFGILIVIAMLALVSVASALPSTIDINGRPVSITSSYFKINVVSVNPMGDTDIPLGTNRAMCMDFLTSGGNPLGTWKVYDTRTVNNGDLPAYFVHIPNWNKVNWIANHENADWRITQAAIWKLDGACVSDPTPGDCYPAFGYASGYSRAAFDAYWTQVQAQGSFVPTYGEYYAALLIKEDSKVQPMAVRVYIPPNEVPEFPTLALPVALLVGIIGAVAYVRTKKE
jgi:hypothetical protein